MLILPKTGCRSPPAGIRTRLSALAARVRRCGPVCCPRARRVDLPDGDLLHVYLTRGVVDVETIGLLEAGDSLRLSGSTQLKMTARAEAEVLVWQMDQRRGDER